jgi:hypothetical protein
MLIRRYRVEMILIVGTQDFEAVNFELSFILCIWQHVQILYKIERFRCWILQYDALRKLHKQRSTPAYSAHRLTLALRVDTLYPYLIASWNSSRVLITSESCPKTVIIFHQVVIIRTEIRTFEYLTDCSCAEGCAGMI